MSNLTFACIAPHGTITIPDLADPEAHKATATRLALEELGRRMAAAAPETIVLITPHGHCVDGVFSLLHNRRVQGVLTGEQSNHEHDLTLSFEVDQELNAAIRKQAQKLGVPVAKSATLRLTMRLLCKSSTGARWSHSGLWALHFRLDHVWLSPVQTVAIFPGHSSLPLARLFTRRRTLRDDASL